MARTPGKLDAESWHAQVEVVTADVPEFFAVEPRLPAAVSGHLRHRAPHRPINLHRRPMHAHHQFVPGAPLNGPTTSRVIQPP